MLLDVAEIVHKTDVLRVSWFNPEKTIAVLEVNQQWQWNDGYPAVIKLNEIVEAQPNPVYTVYYYQMANAPLFPKGIKLVNLRELLRIDPPNEQLVIFVRTDSLLRNFINIISKTYGLRQIVHKYKFVNTWEDALAEIHKHQLAQKS